MAVNPRWRQPLSVWRDYFDRWVAAPEPQELLNATIFFDFRAGYGDHSLADSLRKHLAQKTKRQEIFLLHLTRDCLTSRVPLSFFKNFIVQKDGEHKNKLDIKRQGLMPFVDFARILALKFGIKETNTLARLQALGADEHISRELTGSACEAYELQMQLRLVHQLQQLEDGVHPDNHIDPANLTDLEKRMLKDAFNVIDRLQSVLKEMFPIL